MTVPSFEVRRQISYLDGPPRQQDAGAAQLPPASEKSMEKITVVVADDHTLVRKGLVNLLSLEQDIEVVGEAADGRGAVDLALSREPDVVLMDISMPVLNGLEATRQIKKQAPHVRVLVLSAHDNEEYIVQVIRSGANGYLLKNSSQDDLSRAIRSVRNGEAFFSPSVSRVLLEQYLKSSPEPALAPEAEEHPSLLTPREREVLQLVAEGETHQHIASLLNISIRTVDTHCNNIMKKLDIHDRSGLVTYAIKNSIVILPR
jgi:DNA-binding NarL/FixJ family response regulator